MSSFRTMPLQRHFNLIEKTEVSRPLRATERSSQSIRSTLLLPRRENSPNILETNE